MFFSRGGELSTLKFNEKKKRVRGGVVEVQ